MAQIRVLFFAILKDKLRRSEGVYPYQKGETVEAFASRVLGEELGSGDFAKILLFAKGDEYIERSTQLHDGDEIAFIPPVAGG